MWRVIAALTKLTQYQPCVQKMNALREADDGSLFFSDCLVSKMKAV